MHCNYLLACQKINNKEIKQIVWKIRAKKVILATGSIERFLTFDNNDRPGIMLANTARKYLNHYFVNLPKKIIIFTNNDSAYLTAIDCVNNNINVQAIIDIRQDSNGDLVKKAKKIGIKIFFNQAVIDTKGRKKINAVIISELSKNLEKTIGDPKKLSCDLLLVSGGWTPSVQLFSQSRGKLIYRESDATFIPYKSFQDEISIGSCNGTFELNDIVEETFNKMVKLLSDFGKNVNENMKGN